MTTSQTWPEAGAATLPFLDQLCRSSRLSTEDTITIDTCISHHFCWHQLIEIISNMLYLWKKMTEWTLVPLFIWTHLCCWLGLGWCDCLLIFSLWFPLTLMPFWRAFCEILTSAACTKIQDPELSLIITKMQTFAFPKHFCHPSYCIIITIAIPTFPPDMLWNNLNQPFLR